jgi:hypothetical protein
MTLELVETYTDVTDKRLGRHVEFDPKSADYRVRGVVPPVKQSVLRGKAWYITEMLDQGIPLDVPGWDPSSCTGFSAGYDLIASPQRVRDITPLVCFKIYTNGKLYDYWDGEDYEGSSVLGIAKGLKELGYIGEYRWAFNIDEALNGLSWLGSLVVGTDWLESMFDPLPSGLLRVEGSASEVAGGHAYMINRIMLTKQYIRKLLGKGEPIREGVPLLGIHQSWGKGWGTGGRGLIWADDLEKLLKGIAYPGECRITTKAFTKVA